MIHSIQIENYKSIEKIELNLGRINVFIGENGAGKSNILEAIALAGASEAKKLDNEFLASRGVRVTGPELMRSAFDDSRINDPIKISIELTSGSQFSCELVNDNAPYSNWESSNNKRVINGPSDFVSWLANYIDGAKNNEIKIEALKSLRDKLGEAIKEGEKDTKGEVSPERKIISIDIDLPDSDYQGSFDSNGLEDFIIYSPENSTLRMFEKEGQIEPLGINGEGLLRFIEFLSKSKNKKSINSIKESLKLLSWFDDIKVTKGRSRAKVEIFDNFMHNSRKGFDQRSANEGFLFLTFYFSLFSSAITPKFFAIDNIDTSLNPKLCDALLRRLSSLAKEFDKQVILTTHNPAILDGLDITDSDQRLFVVSRGPAGQTRVRRFEKKPAAGTPRRLSELFLSGALGGLPKGF